MSIGTAQPRMQASLLTDLVGRPSGRPALRFNELLNLEQNISSLK